MRPKKLLRALNRQTKTGCMQFQNRPAAIFFHPDYTVGTGISPVRLQKAVHGLYRRSGICVIRSTLPRRIPSLFFIVIIFTLSENVNTIWTFSHSFANIISMKISNILRTDKTLDFSFYIIGWVCLILALVLGLAWKNGYFLWIFPPDGCVLHNLTGYYCPGCGGTRAIHALLHGHIMRSFFYHPIVVYTAVFFGWFMLSQTIEKASRGRFAIGMHYRDIYLWIALAIVLLNCLVKNLVLAVFGIALLG